MGVRLPPNPHLILQVLAKLVISQGAMILITPWWLHVVWFREAVTLSLQPPESSNPEMRFVR